MTEQKDQHRSWIKMTEQKEKTIEDAIAQLITAQDILHNVFVRSYEFLHESEHFDEQLAMAISTVNHLLEELKNA